MTDRSPKFTTECVAPGAWAVDTGVLRRPELAYFGWRPVMDKGLFEDGFLQGASTAYLSWPGSEPHRLKVRIDGVPEGIVFDEHHRATFWKMVDDLGVGPYEQVVLRPVGPNRYYVERRFPPAGQAAAADR